VTAKITTEPLRVQIHRHLRAHPDLAAHEIARMLDRSAGGITNALRRMAEDGEATATTTRRHAGDTRPVTRWRAS
jgi:hypothetical protein